MGIDPGIANCGICMMDDTRAIRDEWCIIHKRKYRAKSHGYRVDNDANRVSDIIASIRPWIPYIDVIVYESLSYVPHAAVSAKTAMVIGAIIGAAGMVDTRIVSIHPAQLKRRHGKTKQARWAQMPYEIHKIEHINDARLIAWSYLEDR
jgi:Holliday junction resolvasome RuvABC endonuclease subunit